NILVPLIKAADAVHLRRVTLIFYYLCWVGGSSFDVHVQKEVYRRDPGEGRMPLVAFAAVVMLLIVAVVLLWASSSDEGFAAALAPFVLTNIFGWRVILHRVTPMIETTGAYYTQRSRYFRLEQLKLVQWYMTGWWQWFRFFVMIVLVALANVICFSELARM